MVSEYTKRKSFDIIIKKTNKYQRKDFLMKPIISQKLINVLKNKIFNVISLNLFNNVEFLLNNLLNNNTSNQYFDVIFKAQTNCQRYC